ncbi:hypothetical protein DFJ58DRAFT_724481 [Suillus subalutaceus]|uniref:uncharacterized protein n=1 Tax=Suillus subalutaceus TaxID=48586 RepID=UPI001B86F9B3|nr:uncharacterized protein DFJ58DRAFT_724481 [Suillus subalutaceus]KAG1864922.1 hypothetical protein DFJ58DRAFT_724481 [Suillus subalutaceus]
MSLDECRALEALKEDTNTTIEDWEANCDDMSFGDVWDGTEPLATSHAGGEFTDLAREVLGDFWKINNRVQCVDNHTRHDCVLRRNQAFTEQMPVMTDAYLAWSLTKFKEEFKSFFERLQNEDLERNSAQDCGEWSISMIDVFCE